MAEGPAQGPDGHHFPHARSSPGRHRAEPPLTWLDIVAIGAILAVPTTVTKGAASLCIR